MTEKRYIITEDELETLRYHNNWQFRDSARDRVLSRPYVDVLDELEKWIEYNDDFFEIEEVSKKKVGRVIAYRALLDAIKRRKAGEQK